MRYYFKKKYKRFKINDICFGYPMEKTDNPEGKNLVFDKGKTHQMIADGYITNRKKVYKPKNSKKLCQVQDTKTEQI